MSTIVATDAIPASPHCAAASPPTAEGHCCHHDEGPPRLNRRLKGTIAAAVALFLLSLLPALTPLNESLVRYVGMLWWAVLLGLFLGGVIEHFVPRAFIQARLGNGRRRSLLFAVVAGFLLSACSHGILALAIQLYKKGAGVPAVVTFLLASPWANLPVTILLFGFFGWQALLFVGAAMTIALVTGLLFTGLDRMGWIEPSQPTTDVGPVEWTAFSEFNASDAARGVWRGTISLANMVLWWIIVGLVLAAVIGAYVPHAIFADYFGPTLSGLLLTLAAATVIEVCSEGSAPLAFELYAQVGALGNPFVFLMAGVATDYTEIGLLWSTIGRRTAIWLPILTVPQIVLVGALFNQLAVVG